MESNLRPLARHLVCKALNPYRINRGIHFSDQSISTRSKLLSDQLFDFIVGAGYLFEDNRSLPFQTFCKNDARALKADWEISGADLARAVHLLIASRGRDFEREFYKNLIQILLKDYEKEEQLSLPLESENNEGREKEKSNF